MKCWHCETNNVLVRDEQHAKRNLGFDRWVCPECGTSYPDAVLERHGFKVGR